MKIPNSRLLTLHRRSLCASRFLAAVSGLLIIALSLFGFIGIAAGAQQVTPKQVNVPTEMITVQPGQTLADLAEKYFGDRRQYKRFLEYNNIPDINTMKPGDRLQVPVNSNESTNSDQVAPNTKAGKSATPVTESTPTLAIAESTNQATFDSLQTAEVEAVPEMIPPTEVKANDVPNDAIKKGRGTIIITWTAPEDTTNVKGYHVWRKAMPDGNFEKITKKPLKLSKSEYLDKTATGGQSYVYQVASVGASGLPEAAEVASASSKPAIAQGNWYNTKKSYLLLAIIIFSIITLYYMDRGMSGKDMFIRRIAALDTIEEVVGRAAEMGRPAMFVAGNDDPDTGSTMAAFSVFESVANYAVVTQTEVVVPVQKPIVDQVLRSSLRNIFTLAGRPDLFNEEDVTYEVDNQPAFIGIIGDSMAKYNPASVFYFGDFTYESMVFAEMGNNVGAVQVAGCENPKQTAFFIVGCDYCLIGEELFAAGAYLKRDVVQMATLLAQDRIKILAFLALLLGILISIFNPGKGNLVLDFLTF
ncbi:MAG: LysM peptidoglycan-binding domain-containing protein [Candidatus Poribacteria bacterium]|nr:LysM peptidoglycan-binding domain-containing protein [Candidatus Poribacteria bacterium]